MKKYIILGLIATLTSVSAFAEKPDRPSRKEMKERMQAHLGEVLDASDLDSNGAYNESELLLVIETLHEEREARREAMIARAEESGRELPERFEKSDRERPEPEEIISRMMERFDEDGDGELTREEAESAFSKMGKKRGGKGPREER